MIALMLLFIWSNSLVGSERSNALSGWVGGWLKPLIDPQGRIPVLKFDYVVRKLAHLFEYALLGALLVFGTARRKNRSVWLLFLVVLLTAVIDETIQFYSSRTSQVQDIWIDGFGAGIGMLLAYGVGQFSRKRRSNPSVPEHRMSESADISKSRKAWIIIIILLIAATLGFIWGNSLKIKIESQQLSFRVLQLIRPLLDAIFSPENVTDHLVRKLAHFTEFGMLGAELILLTFLLQKLRLRTVLECLFMGLSAAVIDETIQIFSARGSQVVDVLLDFGGVITGAAVTLLIISIISRCRKAEQKRDKSSARV